MVSAGKLTFAFGCLGAALVSAQLQRPVNASVFPSIAPNTELVWHDCYQVFKCARLTVPAKVAKEPKLNQTKRGCRPKDTVTLAIVKLPYVAPPGGPPRLGAVHISLGGWSSSSTNFLVRNGEGYTSLFPQQDLVAIDYRGWGWSTPQLKCFANEDERQQFLRSPPGVMGENRKALEDRRVYNEKLAKGCKTHGGDVAKYMGTYAAAVDHYLYMKLSGDTKMSFWGVSSGSHLAQTIAFLYPQVVHRFLLDSVIPSDLAFTTTAAQISQLKGGDRVLETFFYTCLKAPGTATEEGKCAFARNSTTTAQLRARYDAIDTNIRSKPLKFSAAQNTTIVGQQLRFGYSELHTLVTMAFHNTALFPVLGRVLAEAEARTVGPAITDFVQNIMPPKPARLPILDEEAPLDGILSGVAIDEANHIKNNNDFRVYFEEGLLPAVPTTAGIFAEWRLIGQKWAVAAENRYPGGFGPVDLAATGGKVLVMNNVADPATTDEAADAVAARFSPSAVVRNVAAGHSSFAALSQCLFATMFQFFNLDVLPAPGFRCNNIFAPAFGVQLPDDF